MIQHDALNIVEIDADERIAAFVTYDPEDFDAAIAELDARYLAAKPPPYARRGLSSRGLRRAQPTGDPRDDAGLRERRPPPGGKFAPGDLIEYVRAAWDLDKTAISTSRLCTG